MRNVCLKIQYDGTTLHGWQRQKDAMTVQQLLEDAVFALSGETVHFIGCGRTDAGVHALAYICNFHTESTIPDESFPAAMNTKLPACVRVLHAQTVPDEFHAQFDVVRKRYIYKIQTSKVPNVFLSPYTWHCPYSLDIAKMQRAAKHFLGEHDFEGFCASGATVTSFVRTIYALDVIKDGDTVTVEVSGNGFLYNMVRIIAGTLVYVGSGKIDADDLPQIIESRDRSRAGITAPPHGLYMAGTEYENKEI